MQELVSESRSVALFFSDGDHKESDLVLFVLQSVNTTSNKACFSTGGRR